MNYLIQKTKMNDFDLEQSDESETTLTTAKVNTNVMLPSSKKKVRSGPMNMLGYEVLSSSNLVLLILIKIW